MQKGHEGETASGGDREDALKHALTHAHAHRRTRTPCLCPSRHESQQHRAFVRRRRRGSRCAYMHARNTRAHCACVRRGRRASCARAPASRPRPPHPARRRPAAGTATAAETAPPRPPPPQQQQLSTRHAGTHALLLAPAPAAFRAEQVSCCSNSRSLTIIHVSVCILPQTYLRTNKKY